MPGRIAIVTGSDSGIAEATAVALAQAGYDVGVTWHTDEATTGASFVVDGGLLLMAAQANR